MGFFDDDDFFSKVAGGAFANAFSESMQEYEVNQKHPGIGTLTYTRVPVEKAEEIEKIKTGLFGGGTKKKLAASIREGRTVYTEVLALARTRKSVDRDPDRDPRFDRYEYFYKIATLDGAVIREDVPMMADECAIRFEYNNGDSASETGNADKVDPHGYLHMFLLRYYLKDDEHYVLLTREQFNDLSVLVKYAGSFWHYAEDGVGYRW